MVAKTPPAREKRMAAALNPTLIRETVKKVDRCVARLQELQYTVSGGRKVVGGVSLSPRSTKGYLRTSLRCKQETLRLKNTALQRSPPGKFPANAAGEWRRMSLPAMLLGETVVEIKQATQFAKEAVVASTKPTTVSAAATDPKTPMTHRSRAKPQAESPELRGRRTREKQRLLRTIRTEFSPPSLPRAKARITFKAANSPPSRRDATYRHVAAAHRVSPKSRPWGKKTAVLFPNPMFHSSPSSPHQQKFAKTRSPIIPKTRHYPPHKFIVKSPGANARFQVRIKSPPAISLSPTRLAGSRAGGGKVATPSKLRRSFSPSRLANRLVSPLKSRISAYRRRSGGGGGGSVAGGGELLTKRQQPNFMSTPVRVVVPPSRRNW